MQVLAAGPGHLNAPYPMLGTISLLCNGHEVFRCTCRLWMQCTVRYYYEELVFRGWLGWISDCTCSGMCWIEPASVVRTQPRLCKHIFVCAREISFVYRAKCHVKVMNDLTAWVHERSPRNAVCRPSLLLLSPLLLASCRQSRTYMTHGQPSLQKQLTNPLGRSTFVLWWPFIETLTTSLRMSDLWGLRWPSAAGKCKKNDCG